ARIREMIKKFHAERGGTCIVRLIENDEPLGVTANFEQAIRECTGELIALCDQDDRWSEERLSTAAARFTEQPSLQLLFGDARLIDSEGLPLAWTLFESLEIADSSIAAIHSGDAFT